MENYKMIDYDRQQDGFPCNGSLSATASEAEARWTFDNYDGTVTEQHPLAPERFALLWDSVAASVRENGIFGACIVADPTRLIDPDRYHVITTTLVQDGWLQHRMFLVPAQGHSVLP